jgi:hypothetical protein
MHPIPHCLAILLKLRNARRILPVYAFKPLDTAPTPSLKVLPVPLEILLDCRHGSQTNCRARRRPESPC